jgi:hypothetical protein
LNRKIFVLIIFAVISTNAYAQTVFEYLSESLGNVLDFARKNMNITDYEYNGINALWGAYLKPGKSISRSEQYDAGIEYLMFAAAHTTMADIYLKVYRGRETDGTVVKKDTTRDATPLVRFTPSASDWYCFELINAGDMPAFVSMVVLKTKKNANFSLSTLKEALDYTLYIPPYLKSALPYDFEIPANIWTLFGGNIRQGSSTDYYDTQWAEGDYALLGAGDNSVNNCDVEVVEQYASNSMPGRKLSKNTDSQFPIDYAIFSPKASKYHYLKVINRSSRNASAFLFGFLILKK